MIEAWGRGFDKIKTACDALYNTPTPDYEISDNGIMVHCWPNARYVQLSLEKLLGIDETILSQFRSDERIAVMDIMRMATHAETVSSAEIQNVLEKPKSTVARILRKMCDTGLLQMVGAGRAARYKKSSQNS